MRRTVLGLCCGCSSRECFGAMNFYRSPAPLLLELTTETDTATSVSVLVVVSVSPPDAAAMSDK